MFSRFSGRALCIALVVGVAGISCSQTPTAPSALSPMTMIGSAPQGSVGVPPRLTQNPLRALGATRFVAFGDSITYGVLSSFDGQFLFDSPAYSYTVRLQLALNSYHSPQVFSVVNRGEPAEAATLGGVRRLPTVLEGDHPEVLLLLEGINDIGGGVSIEATIDAIRRMLDRARLLNVPVMLATMYQTFESTGPDGEIRTNGAQLVPSFNNSLRQLAAGRQNVYIVDLFQAFGSDRRLLGGDGLHPTEAGYELMATTFLAAIEAAFPVRGSFQ
jgi:lysophospholipase L1-like esterase